MGWLKDAGKKIKKTVSNPKSIKPSNVIQNKTLDKVGKSIVSTVKDPLKATRNAGGMLSTGFKYEVGGGKFKNAVNRTNAGLQNVQPPTAASPTAQTEEEKKKNSQYNHWGIERPMRAQTIDKDGNLLSKFNVDYMKQRAESPWAKLQQEKLTNQYNAGRSNVMGEAMSGANSGLNAMARQGGITGGGRAALFNAANRDALKQQQALALGYQGQTKDVLTEDIDRQLKVDERNINTNLGQIDSAHQAEFNAYQELLKKQASDYMADSIRAQAGGAGAAGGAGGGGIIDEGKRLIPGMTTGGASEWDRLKKGDKWAAARTVGTLGANVVHDQAARALGIPSF